MSAGALQFDDAVVRLSRSERLEKRQRKTQNPRLVKKASL